MPMSFGEGQWLNPPPALESQGSWLTLTTGEKTDFWRETHYGFVRDSGHFLGFPVEGDFTASLHVRGDFRTLYDQAGLMVRIDEQRWVKTGVEFTDGELFLSAVVTDGRSDWSIARLFELKGDFFIRVTVARGAIRIQASPDGHFWPMLRLAPFPAADRYLVGPMACTPERGGLAVRFSDFELGPAVERDLHDLG